MMAARRKQRLPEPRVVDEDFLRRQSIVYLECAISVMLAAMTTAEVTEVLRQSARDLEELG
jgi:hypothetical protein